MENKTVFPNFGSGGTTPFDVVENINIHQINYCSIDSSDASINYGNDESDTGELFFGENFREAKNILKGLFSNE